MADCRPRGIGRNPVDVAAVDHPHLPASGEPGPSITGTLPAVIGTLIIGAVNPYLVAITGPLAAAAWHGYALSGRCREVLDRSLSKIREVIGYAVAWAVFGPLFLATNALVWPFHRFRGPLRSSPHRVDLASAWQPWDHRQAAERASTATSGVAATEAPPDCGGPTPKAPWLKAVVATMLLQSACVAMYLGIRNLRHPETVKAEPALNMFVPNGTADAAAFNGLSWFEQANQEMAEATAQLVYTSFVGSSIRDYSSTYVNVAHQARRTYQPAPLSTASEDDIFDVWFFGGSTMFGYDIQRDTHTIASEFVRLAERDGVLVRARNYGSPGFVNYQETVRLAQLLSQGEIPEAVIFYDGINDQTTQMVAVNERLAEPGVPSELGAFQIRSLLATSGLIPDGTTELPAPLVPDGPPKRPSTDLLVEAVHDAYQPGIELACALGAQYGFATQHFWQPTIYSKTPLDAGERALLPELGLQDGRIATMSAVSRRIADGLPDNVIDITNSLDPAEGPVLADLAHTNEQGARLVATAIYQHTGLGRGGRPSNGCPP